GTFYVFMDNETFEQVMVPHAVLEADAQFLHDNMELDLLSYEREIIDYILPKSMEFDVVEAENAVAGDTATGATKEVICETGLKVRTPLFIQVGDRIKVNTESGEYITRV
ncbi:MAG: elongation factor P, partial [Candidatus Promineifilaceae bacterium]